MVPAESMEPPAWCTKLHIPNTSLNKCFFLSNGTGNSYCIGFTFIHFYIYDHKQLQTLRQKHSQTVVLVK